MYESGDLGNLWVYLLLCTVPFLRDRITLMYSAPKYKKESVFDGSLTSCTAESLNIRFVEVP